MPQFSIRQPVKITVTQTLGYVVEIWQTDISPTRYKVLHLTSSGDRATSWMPETELSMPAVGQYPPFPNPFVLASQAE